MIHVVGKFNKNKEYLQDICELNILESINMSLLYEQECSTRWFR